ncbi:MAG: hypothetical protein NUW24_03605 [Anaerolineae bacterium]|nr:hypothetical protein [Anaerolineae bacterium]MDH7472460.1 hypothetical protein [Anaerolineae bacterium]
MKRSTGLTWFSLWVFALGGYSLARAWVLWRQWDVLAELGAAISPLVIAWSVLWGVGLMAAGAGLWWRREWGRRLALVCIPLYYLCGLINQFFFVRSEFWRRRDAVIVLVAVVVNAFALWFLNRRSVRRQFR